MVGSRSMLNYHPNHACSCPLHGGQTHVAVPGCPQPPVKPPHRDLDQLASLIAQQGVEAGERWRHVKSQGEYLVICVALQEATHEPVVIYTSVDLQAPAVVWSRPVREFLERFEPHDA